MACVDDQQPNLKHYCRVCNKGFVCGRALGGHMRAHGIGDENENLDDDESISDWEEKFGVGGGRDGASNKRMYQLRTNPNRLKTCRTCENCGKEFLSWKSFLEHGKCISEDASESLVSSPESEDGGEDDDDTRTGSRWSKRKRSLRTKVNCFGTTPSEEDDMLLARCLVQLANTVVVPTGAAKPEESYASSSREVMEHRNRDTYFGPPKGSRGINFDRKAKGVSNPKATFECKACKKVFNSHQALGGHRASHKKVKGCYASKQDQTHQDDNNSDALAIEDDVVTINEEFLIEPPKPTPSNYRFEQGPLLVGAARRKSKVHECSICHRVFTSGQALGGHKRCHWITSNSPETSTLPKFNFQYDDTNNNNNIEPVSRNHLHQKSIVDISDKLDLNIPAWAHVSGTTRDPPGLLALHVSTDMQIQPWIASDTKGNNFQLEKRDDDNNINGSIIMSDNAKNETVDIKNSTTVNVEDEADSMLIKLAKLSDLKEMDNIGSSSQWLQVGIGSTTKDANGV